MSALPLFKIGVLAVRTVSKPVANQLKAYAKTHPTFSKGCEHMGQIVHQVSSRINIRLLGHKIKVVKPLGEAEATAAGADFFGEVFIYGISVAALLAEVVRQDRQNAVKELKKKQRQVDKEERMKQRVLDIEGHFQGRIADLDQRVSAMQATLDNLVQRNEAAAKKRWGWFQ